MSRTFLLSYLVTMSLNNGATGVQRFSFHKVSVYGQYGSMRKTLFSYAHQKVISQFEGLWQQNISAKQPNYYSSAQRSYTGQKFASFKVSVLFRSNLILFVQRYSTKVVVKKLYIHQKLSTKVSFFNGRQNRLQLRCAETK